MIGKWKCNSQILFSIKFTVCIQWMDNLERIWLTVFLVFVVLLLFVCFLNKLFSVLSLPSLGFDLIWWLFILPSIWISQMMIMNMKLIHQLLKNLESLFICAVLIGTLPVIYSIGQTLFKHSLCPWGGSQLYYPPHCLK